MWWPNNLAPKSPNWLWRTNPDFLVPYLTHFGTIFSANDPTNVDL